MPQYDNGRTANFIVEGETTFDEAKKAMAIAENLYEVVIEPQTREEPKNFIDSKLQIEAL